LIPTNSGRQAQAQIIYALHDGVGIHHFEGHIKGMITVNPKGSTDFGWNAIFIPDGASLTYGEMDDSELKRFSHRMSAIQKLKEYLQYR
jgi:non-canonical purine NTP pyrophosphatase (RdgB/HAM1 family)